MTTRAELVAAARAWLGTRWMHQASLRGVGADCIGLIVGVARDCGLPEAAAWAADPTSKGYGRAPDPAMLLAAAERYLDPIPVDAAVAGDILLMRFTIEPQHFAIVSALEPRSIIHAYSGARKVVEHRLDELWWSRILRAYRYRGVA